MHNFVSSNQTKHITRRELIVREREVEGHHVVTKVDTLDNVADLLTKALDPVPFDYDACSLMCLPSAPYTRCRVHGA